MGFGFGFASVILMAAVPVLNKFVAGTIAPTSAALIN